ncbi:hypothetical protein ACFL59_15085 [Planctomycetota bacterium]
MERESPFSQLTGHVVICNCNEKVRGIVEQLHAAQGALGAPFDIVTLVQDRELWEGRPEWHPRTEGPGRFLTLCGCPSDPERLAEARIQHARAAIILADPHQGQLADARSTLVAMAIERQAPQVHTVMELILSVNRGHLQATEINEVVCLGEITEKLLTQSCMMPGSSRLHAHLLTTDVGTCQVFVPRVPEALCGLSYREIARRAIVSGAPLLVCGFMKRRDGTVTPPAQEGGGGTRSKPWKGPNNRAEQRTHTLVLNPRFGRDPGKDTVLGEDDQLIVISRESPRLDGL